VKEKLRNMSFWENYKKEIGITRITKKKVMIFFIVLILSGIGIWQYQYRKDVNFCKNACDYIIGPQAWRIGGDGQTLGLKVAKYFPAQEQCIDYCLTVK